MNRFVFACILIILIPLKVSGQVPDSTFSVAGDPDSTFSVAGDPDTTAFSGPDTTAFSGSVTTAFSGSDTTVFREPDVPATREPDFTHSPTRAIMLALVLPGLGQAYNGKYYKIPIVWAALGGAAYAISFNTGKYRESSQEYALNQDDTNERYLKYWRRNLEISYISLVAVFALQVIDAYVDAQLYNWDVNENLSMRVVPSIKPILQPFNSQAQVYGLTCSLNLKGN